MSHTIFDFLLNSLLSDVSLLQEQYNSISNAELTKELSDYRNYCIKNLPLIESEITSTGDLLRCFGSGQLSELSSLKRTALYVEQIVLPDPIFPLTYTVGEFGNILFEYAGLPNNRPINKAVLATAVTNMLSTRAMVAAGYIKYYPSSYHAEEHDIILSDFSCFGNKQEIPETILSIYRSKAMINNITHIQGRPIIHPNLNISRDILVRFAGLNGRGAGYKLISSKSNHVDKENHRISTSIIIPETPPSKKEFDDWVQRCLISSATNHYQKLLSENSTATKLGSIFSTQSTFDGQILRSSTSNMNKDIAENAIDCVLKMQLPYMEKISAEDLMAIRNNDGEEFKNFRVHFEGKLRELRTEVDPKVIKNKIIDIEHELSAVQVRAINSKVKTVRRTVLAEAGIASIGLVAGIATSGFSLLGSLAAVFQGMKTYSEYREKVKENPCYFLWKVQNKAKKK